MSKWECLVVAVLWLAGLVLVAVGARSRTIAIYGSFSSAPALIAVTSVLVVGWLLWRRSWRKGWVTGRLLLALWCIVPLAMVSSKLTFQIRKADVLAADSPQAKELGRHFMIGYHRAKDIAPLVGKGLIGGIYVSHRNIKGRTADELKTEIASFQTMRRTAGLPPLIVAADQEGGIVSHLSPQLTALPALSSLTELPKDERLRQATEFGRTHGRELADLGVTQNFAPVLDMREASERHRFDFNSLIGQRAISNDPAIVSEVASAYAAGLREFDVSATVKHFPGLGRVAADTHHFRARLDTPVDELEKTDWLPFRDLLKQPQTHLMIGHVALSAIDPDRAASHSKRVVNDLLREKWGYQGVIVTDDMVMGAVYQHDICAATVEAINAGVDLLLVAFDGTQFYRIFTCALAASEQGRLDRSMLEKSNQRLNGLAPRQTASAR
jgi:beta-N-acetylhexosaminidase